MRMLRQGMFRQTAGGLPAGLVRLGGARPGARLPVVVAAAVLAAGCASGQPAAPASSAPAAPPSATAPVAAATTSGGGGGTEAEGVLAAPDRATTAFTYNPALAPEGARIEVESGGRGGSTEIRLDVDGLLPNRGYAAHAHVNACGPTGDAAGPHFQNQVDPAAAVGPHLDRRALGGQRRVVGERRGRPFRRGEHALGLGPTASPGRRGRGDRRGRRRCGRRGGGGRLPGRAPGGQYRRRDHHR